MSVCSERIREVQIRGEQLKRQRILEDNREKERRRKIDTRQKIIIGTIVTKYFPDIVHFQPKRKRADTDTEFAKLEDFFSTIAKDEVYAALFQSMIQEKSQMVHQNESD